ncbi:hypothetical protein GWI33_008357 [Rhynchophorus ferrugineus]|uniref:Uncharacterized protein n=1 Tax=Rhynchophorus ferrugineus TaxID=354439 RepID=A0A834ITF2_RHYFE|nr:hypothetical protein GWI33_008357 [Rhynchophorus ferrugineus]
MVPLQNERIRPLKPHRLTNSLQIYLELALRQPSDGRIVPEIASSLSLSANGHPTRFSRRKNDIFSGKRPLM